MDVRDYEYIVAIAEHGSITKAAAQLYITQSALSRFLQRTEEELGLELFIHQGKQYYLTQAGQKYVETGRVILNLDRQLEEQLELEKKEFEQRIRIGMPMGRTDDFIENIIPKFRQKYPEIIIYLRSDRNRKNVMGLQNGELDLAIVCRTEYLAGYYSHTLESTSMAVLVRKDSSLAKMAVEKEGYPYPVIPKEAINGYPMLTFPAASNSGNISRNVIKKYGLTPNTLLEVSDGRSAVHAVECGHGAVMMMSMPLTNPNLCFVSLDGIEQITQRIDLVHRMDLTLTRPMKALIQIICAE